MTDVQFDTLATDQEQEQKDFLAHHASQAVQPTTRQKDWKIRRPLTRPIMMRRLVSCAFNLLCLLPLPAFCRAFRRGEAGLNSAASQRKGRGRRAFWFRSR